MTLARVIGTVTATAKHPHYRGRRILVVQPMKPDGSAAGRSLLAVDAVRAGIGDQVLLFDEGGSARAMLGYDDGVTIRTVVGGIVDTVTGDT